MKKIFTNLTEKIFYLFLFLLPWQTRWIWHYGQINGGQWEYGTMSLYAAEILLWSIILLNLKSLFKLITSKKQFLFFYLLLFIINLNFSLNKQLTIYNWWHLTEAFLLIWLITTIKLNWQKVSYVFLISVFIQAVLGIWQFINQEVTANKWLGIAQQWPADSGVAVVGTALRRWLRAYGGFSHPNMLGGFLVLGFLVGSYLIINQLVANKKQLYQKLSLIFGNLIILIALLFTFSRAAWISLVITATLFLILNYKKLTSEQKNNLWRLLIYSLTIVFVIVIVFKEPFTTRLTNDGRLEKKSNTERLQLYQESWQLIKKRHLTGVGLGNYTLATHDLIDSKKESWSYQPVHNIFVLFITEFGLIGLVLILLFFALTNKSRKNHYLFQSKSFYLLSAILITSLFDHYWWTSYWGIISLSVILGIIFNLDTKKET